MQMVLGVLFVLSIVVGLVTLFVLRRKLSSKPRKHAYTKIGHTILWAGICGLIWLFMTVSTVPVLGMRVWLPVGVVFFAWLLVAPVQELRVTIPNQEQGASKKASYEKWLPKPKK